MWGRNNSTFAVGSKNPHILKWSAHWPLMVIWGLFQTYCTFSAGNHIGYFTRNLRMFLLDDTANLGGSTERDWVQNDFPWITKSAKHLRNYFRSNPTFMTMVPQIQTDKISIAISCFVLHASRGKNVSVTASQFIIIYYNWPTGASSLQSIPTLTKLTCSNLNIV